MSCLCAFLLMAINEPGLVYFLLSVVVEVAEEWFVSLSVLVDFFLFQG